MLLLKVLHVTWEVLSFSPSHILEHCLSMRGLAARRIVV